MATVVVSAPLPGTALSKLEAEGHRVVVGESPYGLGRDELFATFQEEPETRGVITLLSDTVDRCLLNSAPDLCVIANCAVGVDNLDLEELRRREIVATNTPGVLTEATADLTWGLILDACRNVSRGDRLVREGGWEGWSPTLLTGLRVQGATLGILGFGRIGQAVARRARGFGMRVIYHQRHEVDEAKELGAEHSSLDQLLEESNIVTLHCPLTPATEGIMSRARLESMKQGAVFINAARGPCVDEEALCDLLRNGHLFAAGLDVYADEPHVHPSLLELPNVVLAPHLGSADIPTRSRMAEMCVDAILAVFDGKEPENRVA